MTGGQLTATRCHNHLRTNEVNQHDRTKDEEHHDGGIESHDLLSKGEVGADFFGTLPETRLFIVLVHKGLHDANTSNIFLDRVVQGIVFLKDSSENGEDVNNEPEHDCR